MSNVTIQNDFTYLFLQWLNLDYTFWNVIVADIILFAVFFAVIFVIGFICFIIGES